MSKKTYNHIGKELRRWRTARHMTQEMVAEKSDATVEYYGRIERCECNCTINLLEDVLKTLNLTFELKDKAVK